MTQKKPQKPGLNHWVFWPPFLVLLSGVSLNLWDVDRFQKVMSTVQSGIIKNFGWLFTLVAFASFLMCVWICFSKFGNVRIGGKDAKPLMKRWNWFAITICTTIAVGILLWSTAETLTHFHHPPIAGGLKAKSPEAAKFAMSTMFLHWTFIPYAIYAAASLTFAFTYYNMKKPYSLGTPLAPILGDVAGTKLGTVINSVCLFALVAGMAGSLGTGIITLKSGIDQVFPNLDFGATTLYSVIAVVIIATFIMSSATGLMNGIRILSSANAYALFALGIFVFVVGPTSFLTNFGLESFGDFLSSFFQKSLFTDSFAQVPNPETGETRSSWAGSWPIFYWAVWLAWTPVTACFLGQIAYGRTVKEFMMVNFILPSLFCGVWMVTFGGTAIHMEMTGTDLWLSGEGEKRSEAAIAFELFKNLPLSGILIKFYLISTFVCFVTSADSNTTAMAAISSKGISLENPEGSLVTKVAWGLTVGVVAWTVICFAEIEGIKMICTIGGFPAAFLMVLILFSLFKIVRNYQELEDAKITDTDSSST